jgi:hypothetical protein
MRFKNTNNIFGIDEHFDKKWHNDPDRLVLPPGGPDDKNNWWDYSRELKIEDIDIWEILYEASGWKGVYAAWLPYAEFYLIRLGFHEAQKGNPWETYYGPGAQHKVMRRMKELGWEFSLNPTWVEDEDMWLFSTEPKDQIPPSKEKKIIIS